MELSEKHPIDHLKLSQLILQGFHDYFSAFQKITLNAKALFEQSAWNEIHSNSLRRLDLYKEKTLETVANLEAFCNPRQLQDWPEIRRIYTDLIKHEESPELTESWFNSIFCYLFDHKHIDNSNLFIFSEQKISETPMDDILVRFPVGSSVSQVVNDILDFPDFSIPYEDKARDVRHIVKMVKQQIIPALSHSRKNISVEVIRSLFYRNKGAYLVGRVVHEEGHIPFVLPLLNTERGSIYVDTAILDPDEVSIIFSFTRSYFMVDIPEPSLYIRFLKTLMPHKGLAELYNSIGHNKHGKTEFYRSFIQHLDQSDDEFVLAPGIKGMVMSVFTLPSYDIVFKVIKDKFDPPKEMSKQTVKDKYRLVSRHDRVGRMADTQEYSNFTFPRDRFSPELLQELQKVAPSILEITDDTILIQHLYTERRMIPLNLYLKDANERQTEEVMDEYGNSIKQIATANIFPGDMLLKNFGVTRHGRVVFYDYDEICFLDECNFRKIPEPKTEEQAMASSPWYQVDPNDIFPEEFRLFFTGNPMARKMFEKSHQDLYEVAFWQRLQDNISAGKIEDMFPYRRKKRFARNLQ